MCCSCVILMVPAATRAGAYLSDTSPKGMCIACSTSLALSMGTDTARQLSLYLQQSALQEDCQCCLQP